MSPALGQETAEALSLGVSPSHSLVRLEGFYAALALHLGESIHRSVRFGTSSSHERFRERLERGEFDVAVVQGSDYPRYAKPEIYAPVLRLTASQVVYFAAPESEVRTLADLRGRAVALPPMEEDSTTAAMEGLRAAGLAVDRDVRVVFQPQNSACVQHVMSGRLPAGAASSDALALQGVRAGDDYRVLGLGPAFAAPLVVASKRLPAAERDSLRAALLHWSDGLRVQAQGPMGWMRLTAMEEEANPEEPPRQATQSFVPKGSGPRKPSRAAAAKKRGS